MALGPVGSGFRKATEDDPGDTAEAVRELASWARDDEALRRIVWAGELESRWNPHIENPIGAVGVWQFLPSTCKALGTDASTVRAQGRADQARLLAKMWARKAPAPRDVYLSLFYPAAVGRPDDHVIGEVGGKIWQQNPGLRTKGDGPITAGRVRELGTPVRDWPTGAQLRAWAGATRGRSDVGSAGLVIVVLGLAWYLSDGRSLRLFRKSSR